MLKVKHMVFSQPHCTYANYIIHTQYQQKQKQTAKRMHWHKRTQTRAYTGKHTRTRMVVVQAVQILNFFQYKIVFAISICLICQFVVIRERRLREFFFQT